MRADPRVSPVRCQDEEDEDEDRVSDVGLWDGNTRGLSPDDGQDRSPEMLAFYFSLWQ